MSNQIQLSEIIKREILNLQYYNLSYEDILSPVMIDRLHCLIEIGEHVPIGETILIELDTNGELVNSTNKSLKLSNSSNNEVSLLIRTKTSKTIEVITSPNKYLYSHNIYGSSDIHFLLKEMINKALIHIGRHDDIAPLLKGSKVELHGIDLNSMMTATEIREYLLSLPTRLDSIMHITSMSNTVYIGNPKKSDYAFRIYDKYAERQNKKLIHLLSNCEVEYMVDKLRIELILHRRELEKLNLTNPNEWNIQIAEQIFTTYKDRLRIMKHVSEDLNRLDYIEAGLYSRWKLYGDPIELIIPNKNTRTKYKKSIMDKLGVDISKKYIPIGNPLVQMVSPNELAMNGIPNLDYQLAKLEQIVLTNPSGVRFIPNFGIYSPNLEMSYDSAL